MRNVHGLRCSHCNRPISRYESYWANHFNGGAPVNAVGPECLLFIDGPEVQGLLDYAERYGVRAARDLLRRQLGTGVKSEE